MERIVASGTHFVGRQIRGTLHPVTAWWLHGKSETALEGFYVRDSTDANLPNDAVVLSVEGRPLGLYDNQVLPTAIYTHSSDSIVLDVQGRGTRTIALVPITSDTALGNARYFLS